MDLKNIRNVWIQNIYIVQRKGKAIIGDSLELMKELPDNSINLVITSPPFALSRPKEYGNKNQEEYIDWILKIY